MAIITFKDWFSCGAIKSQNCIVLYAFLPQFINPSRGLVGVQLFVLGFTFVVVGLISDGIYAVMAGRIGFYLKTSSVFRKIEKYFSGSIYCGLGLAGVFYKLPKKVLRDVI